jgi:GNAT superfamily N-acetyltransferase
MKAITIRPARPEDIDAILALWLEGTEHHQTLAPDDFRLSAEASDHYLRVLTERLSKSTVVVLIAVRRKTNDGENHKPSGTNSEEVLGYLIGEVRQRPPIFRSEAWAIINELVVSEQQRRKGIGSRLHEAFEAWAMTKDATQINIHVYNSNSTGWDFWEEMGYTPLSTRLRRVIPKDRDDEING